MKMEQNPEMESDSICYNAFDQVTNRNPVYKLAENMKDLNLLSDSSFILRGQNEKKDRSSQSEINITEIETQYVPSQVTIYVDKMYGNIIIGHRLKKKDVEDPDLVAYDATQPGGNCLLNAVCGDVDVQGSLDKIIYEFGLQGQLEASCNKYTVLYDRLAAYLTAGKMTRFQFLVKMDRVSDVSHLCCVCGRNPLGKRVH